MAQIIRWPMCFVCQLCHCSWDLCAILSTKYFLLHCQCILLLIPQQPSNDRKEMIGQTTATSSAGDYRFIITNAHVFCKDEHVHTVIASLIMHHSF